MRLLTAILAVALLGCGVRQVPVREPPLTWGLGPDFIDLEPGWRLRVVTPLLASGGYRLENATADFDGKTLTVDTGGDFLGYETSFYAVKPRRGGGVRLKFLSAEATRGEETAPRKRPHVELFDLPRRARYVRLIYLTRLSEADHDMAVVAVRDRETLEELTRAVQSDPAAACVPGPDHCSWVPAGIAVRPELKRAGEDEWRPAR